MYPVNFASDQLKNNSGIDFDLQEYLSGNISRTHLPEFSSDQSDNKKVKAERNEQSSR